MTMFYNAIFGIGIAALLGFTKTINNFWVFIVARFLLGINVGVNSSAAPLYINEIAPEPYMGAFGACFQLGVCAGILLSNIFGLSYIMGTESLWPILLALNAAPCILQIFLSFISPETPIYLLSNGNVIEAKKANESLKGENAKLDETETIDNETSMIGNISEIFSNPPVRKALIACIILMTWQQLSGINAIFFYSGSIFASAGIPQDLSGIATVGLSTVNVLFVFVAIIFSDKAGRKLLLIIAFSIMTIMAIVMTVLLSFSENEIIAYLSIAPVCIFVAAFEIGPGPIPWALASESIPTQYKAGSQSLVVVTNWFCAFIIGIIFPPMQSALDQYSFVPFAVVCAVAIFHIKFRVVETSGKSVDQVLME